MAAKVKKAESPREMREKLGINQKQFWGRLGVTQSGGSRYESGRTIPEPTRILMGLVYGPRDAAVATFNALRGDAS